MRAEEILSLEALASDPLALRLGLLSDDYEAVALDATSVPKELEFARAIALGEPGEAHITQAGEKAESLIDVDDYMSPSDSANRRQQQPQPVAEIPDPMDWSKVPEANGLDEKSEGSTKFMCEVSPSVEAIANRPASKPTEGRQMSLIGQSGAAVGIILPLRPGKTVIGRVSDCDLILDDGSTSRYHAEIMCRPDGRTVIRDLGSTNGTWVNGRRVKSQELRANDRVQFGSRTVFAIALP